MSGGIYEGPGGRKLHGDGREVYSLSSTSQIPDRATIERLTDWLETVRQHSFADAVKELWSTLAAAQEKIEQRRFADEFDAPNDNALRVAMISVPSALGGSLKGEAAKEILRLREQIVQSRKNVLEEAAQAASNMTYNGDYYNSKTDQYDAGVNAAVKAIRALSRTEHRGLNE